MYDGCLRKILILHFYTAAQCKHIVKKGNLSYVNESQNN